MAEARKDNDGSLVQMCLFGIAAVLFAAGIGLGYRSEPASASVILAAGVFCLIFAFLSRFKRFKGLGIEAELWEQKQEEAARLVDSLRSLSVIVAGQLIYLSASMGRWGTGTTRKELFELAEKLEQVLKNVDVPSSEREAMKIDLYRYTAIDMAWPIADAINRAIATKFAEQQKVVASFGPTVSDHEGHMQAIERQQKIDKQKVDWDRVRPLAPSNAFYDALQNTIEDADCLTADERKALRASIADELADLREWVVNRRLRRPDHWFAGDSK